MRSWNGRSGVELLMVFYEQSLGRSERAYTSRHPSVFGKRLPDDKLSHLRVWMRKKKISFLISAVAFPRREATERARCFLLAFGALQWDCQVHEFGTSLNVCPLWAFDRMSLWDLRLGLHASSAASTHSNESYTSPLLGLLDFWLADDR